MVGRTRITVLLLWVLAIAAGAMVIARTPFTADLSAFLPDKPDPGQQLLIEQLQSGVAGRTLLIGIEGGTAAQRAQASRRLADDLRASGRFEQVENGAGLTSPAAADATASAADGGMAGIGRHVFDHRYQLSPAVVPGHFSADGLRESIADTLSLLGTPAGNAIKPLLEVDPTGETRRIAETLIPARAPRSEDGVWVSRAQPRAVLLANIQAAGADLDAQAAALATVRQAFASVTAAATVHASAPATGNTNGNPSAPAASPLRLLVSGAPLFAVESRASIESEVRALATAGTVMVGLVLLLAFGSPIAVGVAMLPVLTGVVAGIAAVGIGFGNVHGITLGFGATLMGEAVDYGIYYLIQAHRPGAAVASGAAPGVGRRWRPWREAAGCGGWRDWLHSSWPTVRLGVATSVCGFAALAFSGFPGLAQLGVFSCAGLIAAALATRFVLPVLMPDGARGRGLRRYLGRGAAVLVRLLPRLRRPLLVLGVVAAAGLWWQGRAVWSADLMSLSPVSAQKIALEESLRADLSDDTGGMLVVVQGPTVEAALQATEQTSAVLDTLVDDGRLLGYQSVSHWLPSIATQQQRLASLPDAATLRAALAEATAGGPLSATRLAPFVDAVQAARRLHPVTLQSLQGTPLAPLVGALLLQRGDGSWAALLPLQLPKSVAGSGVTTAPASPASPAVSGNDASAPVRHALTKLPTAVQPRVQVLDIKPELDRLYARYLGEAQTQTALGAGAVLVLMALWLRSWRRLLAVCQPLLLAVLLTLAGLVLLKVQLGILHLVGLLLVVAVGSNYALFFDLLQQPAAAGVGRAPEADHDTLASLALANLTTVLSFGLIAWSSIPALSSIGRVVAPGALLALLLAAAFAKPNPQAPTGGQRAPARDTVSDATAVAARGAM